MKELNLNAKDGAPIVPKVGDTVVAEYSGDGNMYRAKIRRISTEQKVAEVFYIDFGNVRCLSMI